MDAVEIVADASMGTDAGGVTSVSSYTSEHVIVHNDSQSSSNASSPQRSTQTSIASSPHSNNVNTNSPVRNPFEDARLVQQYVTTPTTPRYVEEDVSTEPSTTLGAGEHGYVRSDSAATSTFGRLVESTKVSYYFWMVVEVECVFLVLSDCVSTNCLWN